MKRLIQAYSNNLKEPYIDSEMALQIIENSDHECTKSKLHKDINDMEAIWGSIDDNGEYVLEIYLFNCNFSQKAAYVYDTIVNGQPSGNLQCLVVKEVNGATEARREAVNGLSGIGSEIVTFKNGYKSVDEIPAKDEYIEKASSLANK